MNRPRLAGLAILLSLAPAAAHAQADLFSPRTLHGVADLRLGAASGEAGWLDSGFGKTALSGGDLAAGLSRAVLEWRPRLNFAISGVVAIQVQPDVDPVLDVGEAYLQLRAPPSALGRVSARAGVFYPPVSLEHTGVGWTTPDMLSGSALNSWIGEEVLVAGIEATWRRSLGDHEVATTGAVFGWNDTSGTLLSFRGWALHALTAGTQTRFDLPPLSPFMRVRQADETIPYLELDGRAGYYGALEWRPPAPVVLSALYYDNVGNRTAVEALQWAWETRFLSLGARWAPDDRTTVIAQAINGETLMGYRLAGSLWLDMGFQSAFVLVRRAVGQDAVSGRIDAFATNDRTLRALDDNNEQGWAATLAWRHRLADHADLLVEAQHVASDRPARALTGEAARQGQTVLQTALRLSF